MRACTRDAAGTPRGRGWGCVVVPVIRKLTRRGNSAHVSIPPQVIDHLRWRVTDAIVLEVTKRGTIELRRVCAADLDVADVPPMELSNLSGAR